MIVQRRTTGNENSGEPRNVAVFNPVFHFDKGQIVRRYREIIEGNAALMQVIAVDFETPPGIPRSGDPGVFNVVWFAKIGSVLFVLRGVFHQHRIGKFLIGREFFIEIRRTQNRKTQVRAAIIAASRRTDRIGIHVVPYPLKRCDAGGEMEALLNGAEIQDILHEKPVFGAGMEWIYNMIRRQQHRFGLDRISGNPGRYILVVVNKCFRGFDFPDPVRYFTQP